MGREIRKVVPDWDRETPHFDQTYKDAAEQWLEGLAKFVPGEYGANYFWELEGAPPDPEENLYRPDWTDEERTHFQIYETVSEGTPISPTFATKEELAQWYHENGDHMGPVSKEAAQAFADAGYAPSMVFGGGGVTAYGAEALLALRTKGD